MADPIKFIIIATADDGAFEDAATARALQLCKEFYDLRLTMGPPSASRASFHSLQK
jgi:hypothetical protein